MSHAAVRFPRRSACHPGLATTSRGGDHFVRRGGDHLVRRGGDHFVFIQAATGRPSSSRCGRDSRGHSPAAMLRWNAGVGACGQVSPFGGGSASSMGTGWGSGRRPMASVTLANDVITAARYGSD